MEGGDTITWIGHAGFKFGKFFSYYALLKFVSNIRPR